MTGSADEPVRLSAHGGRRGGAGPLSALVSAARAARDAVYGRLEETRFRSGMTVIVGCLVTAAALGAGTAVLLSHSAPAASARRTVGRQTAAASASPLVSSYRPHPARPRAPAPHSEPQRGAVPAAGALVPSAQPARTAAQAPSQPSQQGQSSSQQGQSSQPSRCRPVSGPNQPDGGRPQSRCGSAWHQRHRPPGQPAQR